MTTSSTSCVITDVFLRLDELLLRLDFRDAEPQVIDLSPEHGVVSTLKEGKIECLSADKVLTFFLL